MNQTIHINFINKKQIFLNHKYDLKLFYIKKISVNLYNAFVNNIDNNIDIKQKIRLADFVLKNKILPF